jgi:polyhydroxyalkanoate synthesis regulator phasin
VNRQHSVLAFVITTVVVLGAFFFIGNMIPLRASSDTSNADTATSNATSAAINEQNKLINDLVNTGKLTEKEAKEIVTRVMLIDELVKSGKFTEEEAKEFVTKIMNNGTDEANVTNGPKVPEANLTTTVPEVPEANLTTTVPETQVPEANLTTTVPETQVPEANLTTTVPEVPEANLTTTVPETQVPEANLTTTVPETQVPEANLTTTVPETQVPEANLTTTETTESNLTAFPAQNNTGLVNLELSIKQNPIAPGEQQTITLIASDPITGAPVDRIFVHLTIKDPAGNIVKDYTDNDGQLSPSFVINEGEVGTFTVLGTALQAGVESSKSLTFEVQ